MAYSDLYSPPRFEGGVIAEWVAGHHQNCILKTKLSFWDSQGRRWDAEPGELINGASIPRFFWRFIGGPLNGRYRWASVIHDAACSKQLYASHLAHRMFYEACRACGVNFFQAWLMYLAVRFFGPKWECNCKEPPKCEKLPPSA